LNILSQEKVDGNPFIVVRGKVIFPDLIPEVALHFIMDIETRLKWDNVFEKFILAKQIDAQTDIVYCAFRV